MGTYDDLTAPATLDVCKQARNMADHRRVEREFGFFQKQRAAAVQHRPQQPEQPQRSIRELGLVLTGTVLAPVFVSTDEVGCAARISFKLQFLELGNRNLKGLFDATKAGCPGPFRHAGDLFQKVAPVRIVSSPYGSVGLAYQLRHYVEVANRTKEIGEVPVVTIHIDLFEIRLREARRVVHVVAVGPSDELHSLMGHALVRHPGNLPVVLAKGELIFPYRCLARDSHCHQDLDLWISASRERSDTRNAAAPVDRFLKPAADRNKVSQEAKRIEEVRLPRSVRPDQEYATL